STTITKGLAVIPPPKVDKVVPPAICDDQSDQKVVINGSYFLTHDGETPTVTVTDSSGSHTYMATVDPASCTAVDGTFTEKDVQLCTSTSSPIPKAAFPSTMAPTPPVMVTTPPPADCSSSEMVTITIEPPPEVDSVVPATVCEGGSQLTINGKNFQQG